MSVFKVKLAQGQGRTAQGYLDTFAATGGGSVSAASFANGIITFTTSAAHGLAINTNVSVAGALPVGYNGVYAIVTVPSTTTFTVRKVSDPGTWTSGGTVVGASVQRGIYAPGPNKINRLLMDGAYFTDCNYWKRFAYPTLPYESAFVEVVTDDGSPYSDFAEENLYPVAYNGVAHDGFTVTAGTTVSTGVTVDFLTDTGNYAAFTQIEVELSDVYVRINGSAIIKITAGAIQTFDRGDLPIGKLEFYNSTGTNAAVSVTASVLVVCNS